MASPASHSVLLPACYPIFIRFSSVLEPVIQLRQSALPRQFLTELLIMSVCPGCSEPWSPGLLLGYPARTLSTLPCRGRCMVYPGRCIMEGVGRVVYSPVGRRGALRRVLPSSLGEPVITLRRGIPLSLGETVITLRREYSPRALIPLYCQNCH